MHQVGPLANLQWRAESWYSITQLSSKNVLKRKLIIGRFLGKHTVVWDGHSVLDLNRIHLLPSAARKLVNQAMAPISFESPMLTTKTCDLNLSQIPLCVQHMWDEDLLHSERKTGATCGGYGSERHGCRRPQRRHHRVRAPACVFQSSLDCQCWWNSTGWAKSWSRSPASHQREPIVHHSGVTSRYPSIHFRVGKDPLAHSGTLTDTINSSWKRLLKTVSILSFPRAHQNRMSCSSRCLLNLIDEQDRCANEIDDAEDIDG